MELVKKHKHIIISGDTGNALGVVRSLGEEGIKPILIYLVEDPKEIDRVYVYYTDKYGLITPRHLYFQV